MDRRNNIRPGRCYIIRVAELPQRRVLVDWVHPETSPSLFHTLDLETGDEIILTADDFLRPCETTWEELAKLGRDPLP